MIYFSRSYAINPMKSPPRKVLLALILGSLLLVEGCREPQTESPPIAPDPVSPKPLPPEIIGPRNHRELTHIFQSHDYDLDTVHKGVPPLVLNTLPKDLHQVGEINDRKRLFFLSVLPMVLMANGEISTQRETIIELFDRFDRGETLSEEQVELVELTGREYKVEGSPLLDPGVRKKLLQRVDIIPPSMALAQAASESAYGTSRFARVGNNLFGEWTFLPGTGLVPEGRPEGETYEVKRFSSLYLSVKSYMKNLNTHRAYQSLREKRARLRNQGKPLRGTDLASGLYLYSIRQEAYVEEILTIIKNNRLSHLATAVLRRFQSDENPDVPREPLQAGLLSTGKQASRKQNNPASPPQITETD